MAPTTSIFLAAGDVAMTDRAERDGLRAGAPIDEAPPPAPQAIRISLVSPFGVEAQGCHGRSPSWSMAPAPVQAVVEQVGQLVGDHFADESVAFAITQVGVPLDFPALRPCATCGRSQASIDGNGGDCERPRPEIGGLCGQVTDVLLRPRL